MAHRPRLSQTASSKMTWLHAKVALFVARAVGKLSAEPLSTELLIRSLQM